MYFLSANIYTIIVLYVTHRLGSVLLHRSSPSSVLCNMHRRHYVLEGGGTFKEYWCNPQTSMANQIGDNNNFIVPHRVCYFIFYIDIILLSTRLYINVS